MKKRNILLSFFCVTLVIILASSSCDNASSAANDGQSIFRTHCVLCHGIDGTLGTNGAKNLEFSEMTLGQRIHIIKKGKKVMTPFEDRLTDAQIRAVAEYTMGFKK